MEVPMSEVLRMRILTQLLHLFWLLSPALFDYAELGTRLIF
ncbi:hypothetical protein PRUB_a2708 [Pseudoalteromonas rubra]|uniref:Uncharacterized protein n=1 Tax=Pseudoalteromonas rubra TaxID=43658 RepID=A0A8T0CCL8_9GAMM|nr:hypothetical protein PRUB_a2708 [Pseudoalteromonas rubra]